MLIKIKHIGHKGLVVEGQWLFNKSHMFMNLLDTKLHHLWQLIRQPSIKTSAKHRSKSLHHAGSGHHWKAFIHLLNLYRRLSHGHKSIIPVFVNDSPSWTHTSCHVLIIRYTRYKVLMQITLLTASQTGVAYDERIYHIKRIRHVSDHNWKAPPIQIQKQQTAQEVQVRDHCL